MLWPDRAGIHQLAVADERDVLLIGQQVDELREVIAGNGLIGIPSQRGQALLVNPVVPEFCRVRDGYAGVGLAVGDAPH